MGVVGLDEDGYFTKIYFNATTGELLDCEHKIPIGGGLYKYNEKIPIIKDKVYGISGISQSPDFINDKSLIIWGYIGEGTANKQIVQISEDDSKTWGDMPIQENVKRIWFANSYSTNDLIFALTENKLLSTTNKGLSWTETFVSNEQIIDVSSSDSEIIIITSIKSYISKNYGITWENINIPTDTILVKHGNKGIWLCTGESLYEYKDGKTEHINLSFMDDKIIGLQVLNDKVAVYGFTKLIIYNKKNNCSDLLNVPEGIKTVECYINNNKTDIYVINLSGDIIKYSKREDDINWNEEIIMDTTDGELMDLELSMSNILYVGLMPRLTWKKL